MVDKDFVGRRICECQCAGSTIDNAHAMLSDGLRHVPPDLHAGVTNLPAKTSKEHYYLFFHDIHDRLEPGGGSTWW